MAYLKYIGAAGATIVLLFAALAGKVGPQDAFEKVRCAWTSGCTVELPAHTME